MQPKQSEKDVSMKKICDLLKQKRQKSGLTQLEVSRKLGLDSGQFVSLMESGKSKVPMVTLGELFEIYKIDFKERIKIFNRISKEQSLKDYAEVCNGETKQQTVGGA